MRRLLIGLVLGAVVLLDVEAVQAARAEIRDKVRRFRSDILKSQLDQLRQLRDVFEVEVIIECEAEPPPAKKQAGKEKVKELPATPAERARQTAETDNVNGLYVLYSSRASGNQVHVVVASGWESVFPDDIQEQLRRAFAGNGKQERADQALVAGVKELRTVLTDRPRAWLIDRVNRFPPDTRARAIEKLRKLRDDYQMDFVIDALEDLPATERRNYFGTHRHIYTTTRLTERARTKAEEKGIDGVYVVYYYKDLDRFVSVIVTPGHEKLIPPNPQYQIYRAFSDSDLHGNKTDADRALLGGIDALRSVLTNEDFRVPAVSGSLVFTLVCGVVLGWVVLIILRRSLERRTVSQERGDRIERLPAQLGAMFGSPAAFFIYDRLFESAAAQLPDSSPLDPAATLLLPRGAEEYPPAPPLEPPSSPESATLPTGDGFDSAVR